LPMILRNTRQHVACQGDFYLQDTTQHDVINTMPLPDNKKCRELVWRRYTTQSMTDIERPTPRHHVMLQLTHP
jgi:hypothetical protein